MDPIITHETEMLNILKKFSCITINSNYKRITVYQFKL